MLSDIFSRRFQVTIALAAGLGAASAQAERPRPAAPTVSGLAQAQPACSRGARIAAYPLPSRYATATSHFEGTTAYAFQPPTVEAPLASDGSFRLTLPEVGFWRLVLSAPGCAPRELWFTPTNEALDLPSTDLVASPLDRLTVVDAAGAPVAGARILLRGLPPPSPLGKPAAWLRGASFAMTDALGRAELSLAGAGDDLLEIAAPGYQPRQLRLRDLGASRTLTLERSEARLLAFRRTGGGVIPVPEALVFLEGGSLPIAKSDAEGRAPVALPPGASLHGLAPDGAEARFRLSPAAAPPERPTVVTLVAPAKVQGRLLDRETLLPIAGWWFVPERPGEAARSDGHGAVTLTWALDDRDRALAVAPGYRSELVSLDVPRSPGRTELGPTVALLPVVDVTGRVVDERGRNLAGAQIEARFLEAPFAGPGPTVSGLAPGFLASLRRSLVTTRSDATGAFRLTGLVPGARYALRALAAGRAPTHLDLDAPRRDERQEPLRIVLSTGRRVEGRVLGPDGQPVPGAFLELAPSPPATLARRAQAERLPDPALRRTTTSDPLGRFAFVELADGRYDLRVRAAGLAELVIPGLAVSPEAPFPEEIRLEEEANVLGQVVDAEETPIAGATVRVVPADDWQGALALDAGADLPSDAMTGTDGWFRLSHRRAGEALRLEVRHPDFAQREVEGVRTPTEPPLVVRLERTLPLAGRVLDERGQALAGVRVAVDQLRTRVVAGFASAMPRRLEGVTDEAGTFALSGLEPGRVEVEASLEGYQTTRVERRLREPGLTDLEIRLRPGVDLRGLVLGPEGTAVVGAEIRLAQAEEAGVFAYRAPLAVTDGDGRFRLSGQPLRPLVLQADHPDLGRTSTRVDPARARDEIELRFPEARRLLGQVISPDGAPLPRARVRLRGASLGFSGLSTVSDSEGRFRFTGLQPGRYEVEASLPGLGRTTLPAAADLRERQEGNVILQLEATAVLTGRLLGIAPTELSSVDLFLEELPNLRAEVAADGTYRIQDLPRGRWRLAGSAVGGALVVGAEIEADGTEIVLDLVFGDAPSPGPVGKAPPLHPPP